MNAASDITIARVEVFPGRLRLHVRLGEDAPRFVTQAVADVAFEAYPTLPLHSCINAQGPTFGDVAVGTSVPHLLEHLVIAEQVSGAAGRDATFVGTTEWGEGGPDAGEAVVEVSFVDDLEAIAALNRALDFLNDVTGV